MAENKIVQASLPLQAALLRREIEPRPYQRRINTRLTQHWRRRVTSQIVVAPCGAGKTVMGFTNAREFVNEVAPSLYDVRPEEVGVFWMAMRRNLLNQTNKDNRAFAPVGEEFYCPNMHFVSSFDSNPNPGNYKIRLLISDEAHHSSTVSEASVLSALKPDHVLGLSATPERKDNAQLCFQMVHRDAGYRVLIGEGYLSQFAHYSLRSYTPTTAALAYIADPARWGKTLFFFRTVEECDECEAVLKAHGIQVALNKGTDEDPDHIGVIVKGGTDRASQLDAFESGEFDVLISMGILTEGFNCPSLQTVFVRDTTSDLQATQMAGRVLRLHKGMLKNIVQSTKCPYPFIRNADAAEQYVQQIDNSWISLKPSKLARQLMDLVAERIRETPVMEQLPDWREINKSIKYFTEKQMKDANGLTRLSQHS